MSGAELFLWARGSDARGFELGSGRYIGIFFIFLFGMTGTVIAAFGAATPLSGLG